jgi:hypothetical protein
MRVRGTTTGKRKNIKLTICNRGIKTSIVGGTRTRHSIAPSLALRNSQNSMVKQQQETRRR